MMAKVVEGRERKEQGERKGQGRVLPEGWRWVKLGDVAKLERGKFTPRPRNDPRYYGGKYPWIQTGEVEQSGKYITSYGNTLNDEGLAVSRLFSRGTLVITIAATIGALGILTFDACMPDSLVGVVPMPGITDTDFLYYLLLLLRNNLKAIAPQLAQANLNLRILNPLPIPLPPIAEQKRIVAILGDRLSTVEQARLATEAQLEAAQALPAAYLRQIFNSPEAQTWEKKRLEEIANLERGKFTPRPRNDPRYYGGDYPWIQTGEVERSGKYITKYSNTLNEKGLSVSRIFPKGTLVITIAATIGAVGILDFDSCMPDSLVGITPIQDLSETEFLYYLLLYFRDDLMKAAPQMAQANLKLSILKPLEVKVPSVVKQRHIETYLNSKFKGISVISQSLQDQLDTINALPAALLRQAFNGEL